MWFETINQQPNTTKMSIHVQVIRHDSLKNLKFGGVHSHTGYEASTSEFSTCPTQLVIECRDQELEPWAGFFGPCKPNRPNLVSQSLSRQKAPGSWQNVKRCQMEAQNRLTIFYTESPKEFSLVSFGVLQKWKSGAFVWKGNHLKN